MEIIETYSSFLSERKEGKFYESSTITYRRKLDVFHEYLVSNCNLTDNNWKEILRGMDERKFISSASYYIEQYNVQFATTLDSYFSILYSYFRFLRDSFKITNKIIDSEEKLNNLKKAIVSLGKEYNLITREQKSPISEAAFTELLVYCEKCIDISKSDLLNKLGGYNGAFTDYVSAIITKLVMFTGLKNKCVISLVRKDFDDLLNLIKLNNYWIRLPSKLTLQLKEYLEIRDSIIENGVEALFITSQGKPHTTYASMFKVLKPILDSKEAESVAKFVIMEQIKGELSIGLIKKLTGFSFETCLHCAELVEEENEKRDKYNVNRQIDSKLRGLVLFDRL